MELIAAGGGVFEVEADGERIHSKKETGEFPADEDIVRALRAR